MALQEVGDAALDDLISLLTGGPWQRQLFTHPDTRGIRVAWLTRRPISDPAEITTFPAPLLPV